MKCITYIYLSGIYQDLEHCRVGWHCLSDRLSREMVKQMGLQPTMMLEEVQPQSSLTSGTKWRIVVSVALWPFILEERVYHLQDWRLSGHPGVSMDVVAAGKAHLTRNWTVILDHSSPQPSHYTERVSLYILASAHVFHSFAPILTINDRIILNKQLWLPSTALLF